MVGYSWWFGWIVKRFQRKIIEASVIWSGILFLQETLQMNWKKQGLFFVFTFVYQKTKKRLNYVLACNFAKYSPI